MMVLEAWAEMYRESISDPFVKLPPKVRHFCQHTFSEADVSETIPRLLRDDQASYVS